MAEPPKKPLSGYMIWLNSVRASIMQDNPNFRVTDVAKLGGGIWRNMNDKSEWQAKAVVAKQKYEAAVEEFKRNGGDMSAKPTKKRKKKDTKEAPAKRSKRVVEVDDSD
jgi:HMG (high mobility group) box